MCGDVCAGGWLEHLLEPFLQPANALANPMPERHRARRPPRAHSFLTLSRGCKLFSRLWMLCQSLSWGSWVCPIPISILPCQLPTGSSAEKQFPANSPVKVPANGSCWALGTALKPFPGVKRPVRLVNTLQCWAQQCSGADGQQEFFPSTCAAPGPGTRFSMSPGVKNTSSHAPLRPIRDAVTNNSPSCAVNPGPGARGL